MARISGSSRRWTALAVAMVVAIGLVGAGCGSDPYDAGRATTVKVYERDFAIGLSTPTATAGTVTLTIQNAGPSAHELVIFRTDLPAGDLPLGDDGNIDEDDPALENVFDTGDQNLSAGETRTVTAELEPGRYVVVCNLPGHYAMGMRAPLVVLDGSLTAVPTTSTVPAST